MTYTITCLKKKKGRAYIKTCVSLVNIGSPDCHPGFLPPSRTYPGLRHCVGGKGGKVLPILQHGQGGWCWLRRHLLAFGWTLGWITAVEAAEVTWSLPRGQREEPKKLSEASHIPGHIQMICSFCWQTILLQILHNWLWTKICVDIFPLAQKGDHVPGAKKPLQSAADHTIFFGLKEKGHFSEKSITGDQAQQYYKAASFAISSHFLSIWFSSFQMPAPPQDVQGSYSSHCLSKAVSNLQNRLVLFSLQLNSHLPNFLLSLNCFWKGMLWTNAGKNGW